MGAVPAGRSEECIGSSVRPEAAFVKWKFPLK
jgi:hypothetical protein